MHSSGEVGVDGAGVGWDLGTAARVVGNLVWFDRRSSETLASWSRTTDDPAAAVAFVEQARQRAWHADLWFERLPELRELPASSLVVPSGPATVAFAEELERAGAPDADAVGHDGGGLAGGAPDAAAPDLPSTALRLAILVRVVLPHQVSTTRRVAEWCSAAADRALARTAELIRRDQVEHWQVLAALLQDRMGQPAEPERRIALLGGLAARQARLEASLLAAGGLTAAI